MDLCLPERFVRAQSQEDVVPRSLVVPRRRHGGSSPFFHLQLCPQSVGVRGTCKFVRTVDEVPSRRVRPGQFLDALFVGMECSYRALIQHDESCPQHPVARSPLDESWRSRQFLRDVPFVREDVCSEFRSSKCSLTKWHPNCKVRERCNGLRDDPFVEGG